MSGGRKLSRIMNPKLKSLLTFSFMSSSTDVALLLLRVWLGISILLIHGLGKLQKFDATLSMFHDKLSIATPFAVAAIVSETLCAILLVVGFATRWAALFLAVTMAVAFVKVHGGNLT